jgi:hypothetical protein
MLNCFSIANCKFLKIFLGEGFMGTGQAQEAAGQRKETIALIALTSEAGEVSASYKVVDRASREDREEIARKLVEIAREITP